MAAERLSLENLRTRIADGSIDTVVLAIADMQGRLQGKRLDAQYFVDDVVEHATEGCNYLLAVDVEMNTVEGYEISSWLRRLRHGAGHVHASVGAVAARHSDAARRRPLA
jgi:glutamine synthetase